jgi:Tol biopolymer transport system component
MMLDLQTGAQTTIDTGLNQFFNPTWSPNETELIMAGKLEASQEFFDIYRVPLDGSGPINVTNTAARGESEVRWMRPNEVWYVADGDLYSRNLTTEVETLEMDPLNAITGGADVNPELTRVVYQEKITSTSSQLRIWTLATGTFLSHGTSFAATAAWFGDGSRFAYRDQSSGQADVFTALPAGGGVVRVTNTTDSEGDIRVSIVNSDAVDLWALP